MKDYLYRLFFVFCCIMIPGYQGFPAGTDLPEFKKINPVTRSDIKGIFTPDTTTSFILTDKIFSRDHDSWQRFYLPDAKTVDRFFPLGKDDFWYTVNTALNTTELFHYSHGRTEKVSSPFANEIISIWFSGKDLGFFAGWGEMAVYENGTFRNLPPPPSVKGIIKVFGTSGNRIWLLSAKGELFFFTDNTFTQILPGEIVRDFCFDDSGNGFILTASGVFEQLRDHCRPFFKSPDLTLAMKMALLDNGRLVFAGKQGFILLLEKGILKKVPNKDREDLTGIAVSGKEIWITGEKGTILYSGPRHFLPATEHNLGFTKNKIYDYGGDADDEYGVAIADFNTDGKNDIYSICIFNLNRLYINLLNPGDPSLPGNHFREQALKRGASGISEDLETGFSSELQLGVTAGDVDNDGDQDIYISSLNSRNKLLLNDGKGFFRDVSSRENAACADLKRSNTAAFADVDNDGDLDLFVTSEEASNKLCLNDGAGQFTDVTAVAGLESERGGMCASFADINLDGLPDLCVSSWFSPDKIFLNETRQGKVRFRDITAYSDLARQEPGRSNAVVFADVNNDGLPDLYIARRNAPNKFYLNTGHGIFRDATHQYFGDKSYLSNGAVFADFDLDGYVDLYVTNVGENIYFRNREGKYFSDATDAAGADLKGYGTGCATGDLDNDGDPDLYVANYINGNSTLFVNNADHGKSVKFNLKGTRSNRDAIGARITLYRITGSGREEIAGTREINGGSGYGSISAKESVFGIQPGESYRAVIHFPCSGISIMAENILAGQVLQIEEESGISSFISMLHKDTLRFFIDRENQAEILKYLFALGLISLSLIIHWRKRLLNRNLLILLYLSLFLLFLLSERLLLYEGFVFSFMIPEGIVVICLVLFHLITERISVRRTTEQEKIAVRESISRDLHDDLASTLGSISIYSNTLKSFGKTRTANFPYLAEKIAELSQSAIQSISDIIWMTSPKHDSLKSLLSKIRNHYYDLFNDNQIRFTSDVEIPGEDSVLSDRIRHNIFLIMKEVANNIIRHAGASEVDLITSITGSDCRIEVSDNGKGFSFPPLEKVQGQGYGLLNMQRRAGESGIMLDIRSAPGKGTTITLSFKITQTDH
ncbi:MAG: FG-GAP-like repeat-containing protein [bacterium]